MITLILALLAAGAPTWFDSYQSGVDEIKAKNYDTAIQHLSAAIEKQPHESDVARRDEKQTVKYHPYYYRGYAYLQTGDKKRAADDLARANGRGDLDLGDLDDLRDNAGPDESQASGRRSRAVAASAAAGGVKPAVVSVTTVAIGVFLLAGLIATAYLAFAEVRSRGRG